MSRSRIIEAAREHGYSGITSNDAGRYTCHQCGAQWNARERFQWWPIRLRWSRPTGGRRYWFTSHGVQVGCDGIEQRVYQRVVRLGPWLVIFGGEL